MFSAMDHAVGPTLGALDINHPIPPLEGGQLSLKCRVKSNLA